jgi:hypothetical protein
VTVTAGINAAIDDVVPATVPVTVSVPPALAAKLADPGVAESLSTLLSHADLAAILLTGLDGFISRTEVIGNSLLAGLNELRGTVDFDEVSGFDVKGFVEVLRTISRTAPQLLGMLEPTVTNQLAMIGKGLQEGSADYVSKPIRVDGPMSALKLLKDPEIARTISYAATVAKAIGRELGTQNTDGRLN